jgi:UDPglucose--hexose-1-phosphate uridylyltransferase
MPELRFNIATKEWVIIATDRAKRPEDFAAQPKNFSSGSATNCPFCPGKEAKTPKELSAVRGPGSVPDTGGWRVRVIPNAFPALAPSGELERKKSASGFLKMNGVGSHYVIIESPDHEALIATMAPEQVEDIYLTYRQCYLSLAGDPRFESVILFKNHGQNAGTSLHHPHSQIVAMPVTPRSTRERLEIAQSHFDETGSCLYCDLIAAEKSEGERIVLESANFIAFVPFASRVPFELWVAPKTHQSNFETITVELCRELAGVMRTVLGKLHQVLHNPDFNYAVFSAPCREHDLEHFHWNLKIFPRLTSQAGFEVGSGMMINTVVPETAAKYLRGGISNE